MKLDARTGGLLGFAAIAVWTVLYLVAAASTPTYTITGNYLSDLGNPSAPAPWAFNAANIVGGILFAPFGFVVGRAVGGRLGRAAQVLLVISAIGLVFVGVFPEESPYDLHTIFSAIFFLLLSISAALVAVPMYRSTTFQPVGGYLAGITVAAAVAFLGSSSRLVEHVAVYAALVWQTWTALRIYRSTPPAM